MILSMLRISISDMFVWGEVEKREKNDETYFHFFATFQAIFKVTLTDYWNSVTYVYFPLIKNDRNLDFVSKIEYKLSLIPELRVWGSMRRGVLHRGKTEKLSLSTREF